MKATTLTQHFRKTKLDENGQKVERKRDSVDFVVNLLAGHDDLAAMVSESPDALVTVVNDALIGYAKKLFGQNSDNWNYVPETDAVTIQALADDLNAPRQNARILTKANLELFATWYRDVAAPKLGKSDSAARNGGLLIEAKFAPALNRPPVVEAFISTLSDIAGDEALMDSLDDTQSAVMESLLNLLLEAQSAKAINLDDI